MKEYLMGIVGVVLISAILTAIIPRGKNANIICGIAKIICLFVIVSPLFQFFQNRNQFQGNEIYQEIFSDSVIETDKGFIKYYSESTVAYFANQLENEILEKYGKNVAVTLNWEYEENNFQEIYPDLKIKIVQICVETEDDFSEEDKCVVWKFLTNNYCSEVLIE